jgi:hypothetical protein
MNRFAFLILGLIVGLGGSASASIVHRNTGYIAASASGIINRNGTIVSGQGFTVDHPERGKYVIKFSENYFSHVNCAALVLEGVYRALFSHVIPHCGEPVVSFDVRLQAAESAIPDDRTFSFVAVGVQPTY